MRLLITGFLVCLAPHAGAGEKLPPASEVTRRLVERSRAVARAEQEPSYSYEKRSLAEHLDAAGQIESAEERVYQVTLIAGFPSRRLVKIRGRELSDEELKKEERKEEVFRQRFSSADAKKMHSRPDGWVTPELLERYQFTVQERVVLSNRSTLVMSFAPKPGTAPAKTLRNKLLNRLAGTLWVDEVEGDIAKLTVGLTDSISIGWFGVLGSLSRCDFSLERQRLPEGVWVECRQALYIQFRKVTATTRLRFTEACSGFKKVQ